MADGSTPGRGLAVYERSSASFLAKQPATMPAPQKRLLGWTQYYSYLEERLAMMNVWRLSWWEHWALLAQYLLPRRYHWLINPNNTSRGFPLNQAIVDPTGTQAMRVCASGLMSGLTSPSRPWFKLKPRGSTSDLDQDAVLWFEMVESRIYEVMAGSNFYDSMAQMYEDLVVFGTAPVLMYEDDQDILRCYNPCAGEYFLSSSSSLRNNTFYRKFVLTTAQIVDMFGLDNCPAEVQSMWVTKGSALETERIVAHAIEPNFPILNRGTNQDLDILEGDYPYREVYWLFGSNTEKALSIRGFNDTPFITPRWATTSNDPYGRSIGMDCLPDVMQLQVQTKRKAEAIEKQVRPPMLASVELKNEPSSILPGHVTYVSNLGPNNGMRPIYEVQPELQYMTLDLSAIQERIKRGFFNDLFLMLQDVTKEMTATEVAEKKQEKLQVLGPVIERLQNEALAPAIKRVFNILVRKKLLPPLPPSLADVSIQIEYISMLSLAQKAAATAGMERLLQVEGALMATDPDVGDLVDKDEFVREYASLLMVNSKIMRSPEQVAAMRKARQQQQAAQAAQQQAQQQSAMAVQGAETLSKTDVGGGVNALQMMLGQSGSGGVPAQ